MSGTMSFLELRGIAGGYERDAPVLNDFHLTVEQGELVSLLGPSGCGKTTTLRVIAGFLAPSAGRVLIAGNDMTRVPPNKRNIGLVFQSYALFPHLSVFDNVAFGLRMRKVSREESRERIERALAITDLTGLEARLPSQLSGGQRQRVALSRAIVIEPTLLLLDEPLSNLDAKLRVSMRVGLARIQRTLGITMIYVTHDQIEALSLSDKVVVMNRGNIEQIGTPEEIYGRPGTPFVSRFMGFDNHIDGTVVERSADGVQVRTSGGLFTARPHAAPEVSPGEAVGLFFRPEDGELIEHEEANCADATVRYATFQGKSVQYLVAACDTELAIVVPGSRRFSDGSRCFLKVAADKLLVEAKEEVGEEGSA